MLRGIGVYLTLGPCTRGRRRGLAEELEFLSDTGGSADLWREVEEHARPLQGRWDVVWVPSHTADGSLKPEVAARRLAKARAQPKWQEDWVRLNGLADEVAPRGLVGHAVEAEGVRRVHRADRVAETVLAHMAATVLREAAATPRAQRRVRWSAPTGRPRGRPAAPVQAGPTLRGHFLEARGGGWVCTRCGRAARALSSIPKLRSSRCARAPELAGRSPVGREAVVEEAVDGAASAAAGEFVA